MYSFARSSGLRPGVSPGTGPVTDVSPDPRPNDAGRPVGTGTTSVLFTDTGEHMYGLGIYRIMRIANRVARLEESATIEVKNLLEEMEADGADVVNMSIGDPDFDTPDHVSRAAIDAIEGGKTHLTGSRGIPALREAIARKLTDENGVPSSPDQVLVTPGSKYAAFEAMLTLVEEGDEVAIPRPAWVSYDQMAKTAGGTVASFDLDPAAGFTLDEEAIVETVSDDTRLLIVNTPANPTGAVFPRSDLELIRDLAVEHDFWVLADEIYEKLIYDGEHVSIGSLDGMAERTVTINGFSKAWAMVGWRLGYLSAPEWLVDDVSKVHSHSLSAVTTFVQHSGLAALEGTMEPVEEIRSTFNRRRDVLVDTLENRGVEFPAPDAGLYAFVPVDGDDVAISKRLLEDHQVATTPGSAFDWPGFLRLAFTLDESRMVEGIERIADEI